MIVEHPILLNVSGRSMGQTIHAVQNDTGRRFRIKFKDYDISAYSAGTLDWKASNGATGSINGTVDNGSLVVDPTPLLEYEGPFRCQGTVNGVSSTDFTLIIEPAIGEDGWSPPPEPEHQDIDVQPLSVNENGTYTAPSGKAYSPVSVNVQGGITPTGTKNINSNGIHDVTNYASANVQVPNTYAASDEGKVVDDGALVAQTSRNIDNNGTYDTTLNNSVVVNVSGGGDTMEWYCSRSVSTFTSFSGMYSGKNFIVDFKNYVGSLGGYNYMGMIDGPNGKLTFKGLSSSLTGANMNTTDFLRHSPCFQEIDFGGLAPATMTRWFRDWGIRTQDGKYANIPVTITNLSLDNLSSNNDSFSTSNTSDRYYHNFDVYFTGELKTSITLSGWTKLNADSWNRLVECLYDYSEGTAHTLTVGSTILAMIDATHQAMAAARGWTLA